MKINSGLEKLEWDSSFFRKKIAKIVVNDIDSIPTIRDIVKNNEYDVIYLFSPVSIFNDISKLFGSDKQFFHVDRKITLELNLESNSLNSYDVFDDISIAPFVSEEIINLAYDSGHLSRFYKDERFREYFCDLYKIWIEKDFSNGCIFIKKIKDKIVGLVSVTICNDIANIGLVAVNSDYRGNGIGVQLFRSLFSHLMEQNIKSCRVVTQSDNIPALKLYNKVGFKTIDVIDVWHYWR